MNGARQAQLLAVLGNMRLDIEKDVHDFSGSEQEPIISQAILLGELAAVVSVLTSIVTEVVTDAND